MVGRMADALASSSLDDREALLLCLNSAKSIVQCAENALNVRRSGDDA
jgi:hypothetical protein